MLEFKRFEADSQNRERWQVLVDGEEFGWMTGGHVYVSLSEPPTTAIHITVEDTTRRIAVFPLASNCVQVMNVDENDVPQPFNLCPPKETKR